MEGGTHDNDEQLSFIHIATATANVVRFLFDKKQEDGETEDKRRAEDERSKQESRKLPIIGG